MEPDLAELLESCGLSHLRQKIEEERFDWETLKCLDITTVACLTPFGGEQCKLLQKIAEYKRRTVEVSAIGSPPSSDLTTNSSALVHSQSSGSTSSCASTSSTASPLASTSSTSSSKRPSSSNATSGAAKRYLTAIDYVQKFEKYDLRKALETDALCKHILLAYQSEVENYNEDDVDAVPPVLSDFQRDKLTALIGTFIRSVTIYPDHKLYPIFTRKIKEVFPFESEVTLHYFCCVGDIKEAVEKRRAQMISGGKGAPLIVVVDQEKSQSACVSVAKLLYKVESVLHALDLCFKSFFALHIAYPDESKHIWIVLQRAIYGFTTEWDPEVIQSSWIQAYA
ncbi:uncharacterized protein LOC127751665 [Frankliniella occidentalis]|uniref:Uncharacterized protein LOC127751665 n=1 Tax=Frankliniella occidentalis TaxID=133901 RepID=A0A9C6X9F2_FRAOC|nr:uncharacterized protein LOC127751665 [Frankliniella occidentalis]